MNVLYSLICLLKYFTGCFIIMFSQNFAGKLRNWVLIAPSKKSLFLNELWSFKYVFSSLVNYLHTAFLYNVYTIILLYVTGYLLFVFHPLLISELFHMSNQTDFYTYYANNYLKLQTNVLTTKE